MKNSNSNNCNFCRLARFPLHFTLTRFLSTFSPLLNSSLSSPTLTPSLHLTSCPLILPTTSPLVPHLSHHLTPCPLTLCPLTLCPLIHPTTSPPHPLSPHSLSPHSLSPHSLSPHPSHHLTSCPLTQSSTSPPVPSSFPPPHLLPTALPPVPFSVDGELTLYTSASRAQRTIMTSTVGRPLRPWLS